MTLAAGKRRSRAANMCVVRCAAIARFARKNRRLVAIVQLAATAMLCTAGAVQAQARAPAEGPALLPLVLTLVFVLALIPVAVWMLKRLGGGHTANAAGLRVVAQLPLGQRERLVVVEAGERWLLLGVTAAAINRVGTLPKGELPATTERGSFASLLGQARRSRDDA